MNKLFVVCLKRYIRNLRVKGLLTSVWLLEESMMSGYEALRVGDSIVLLGIFRRYWIDQCTSRDKIRTNHLTSYVSKSLCMNCIMLTLILKWDMPFHTLVFSFEKVRVRTHYWFRTGPIGEVLSCENVMSNFVKFS